MEHVVFFPAADGSPAFRRVPSLDEAVRLVEHLRNVEGLSTVSVHALTEVPLAFRAYYRVEIPTAAVLPVVPAQAVGIEPRAAHLAPEPVVAVVAPGPAGLVLVDDLDAGEPAAAHAHDAPAEQEREPALSSPASLGFFA
jgi:hypothetical protein